MTANRVCMIYQTDVRAIQLAKAALYAGAKLLIERRGAASPERITLAGAFGSHIDPIYAMALGLIPDCDLAKVAAAATPPAPAPASRCSISPRAPKSRVVRRIEKIETAIEPNFQSFSSPRWRSPTRRTPFRIWAQASLFPPPRRPHNEGGRRSRHDRLGQIGIVGSAMLQRAFDVAIVGAGICGLAHALAAARRGKRVVVVDRDRQANGASIRNFGFITVTGQQAGECWRRARRSREVWAEVADAAGIPVLQRGLLVIARRPEARAVLEQFLATDMGAECRLVEPGDIEAYGKGLRSEAFAARCLARTRFAELREAIPRLAAYLAERHGVTFRRETVVHAAAPPRLETSRGTIEAGPLSFARATIF